MESPEDVIAVRLRILGRVQGVWYRAWAAENAAALGLDGFVRNRKDGSVEALFRGPKAQVEMMLERCKDGPERAQVAEIIREEAHGVVSQGFRKLPTV